MSQTDVDLIRSGFENVRGGWARGDPALDGPRDRPADPGEPRHATRARAHDGSGRALHRRVLEMFEYWNVEALEFEDLGRATSWCPLCQYARGARQRRHCSSPSQRGCFTMRDGQGDAPGALPRQARGDRVAAGSERAPVDDRVLAVDRLRHPTTFGIRTPSYRWRLGFDSSTRLNIMASNPSTLASRSECSTSARPTPWAAVGPRHHVSRVGDVRCGAVEVRQQVIRAARAHRPPPRRTQRSCLRTQPSRNICSSAGGSRGNARPPLPPRRRS